MFQEYFQAMTLIFIAEMGDKTQILAMAFATQFKISEVLGGVFLGSLLNHGIAVIVGAYLSNLIPINAIQIIAGFAFIGFALWTLKAEKEDEEEIKNGYGPILTVAMAFFIGELGDKTQLTAITLATDAIFPLLILMGTVTGMILTSGAGIFIGSKLGDKIPEFTIKITSASIFMTFGLVKLYNTLPEEYITPTNAVLFLCAIGALVYIILKPSLEARKQGQSTVLQEVALTLYKYRHHLNENVDKICLGEGHCGKCQGKYCVIGYTKEILDEKNDDIDFLKEYDFKESLSKEFNQEEVINGLAITIVYLGNIDYLDSKEKDRINKVRNSLEKILFNEKLDFKNKEHYMKQLKTKDKNKADKIMQRIKELSI